jgi:hypothetical protein
VHPDIGASNINTVQTTFVTTTDCHVVRFSVCAGVHDEMEHRSVNENDIVNREVVRLFNTEETSTVSLAILVVFVTETFGQS